MTQDTARDNIPSNDRKEHLAQQIHQLESRLQQIDPSQDPTLYRSLYCMISLRQKQLLSHINQQQSRQHRQAS